VIEVATRQPATAREGFPDGKVRPLVWIGLSAGLGLLLCAVTNALARATLAPPSILLWAGILMIVLPIAYRLTSRDASPAERLALVCLLGLSLYAVKVVRDAPLFTFTDEPVHAFNADQIANHHELFRFNPILPVTVSYPGLESATSALMTLTGMSSYGAGMVVVAVSRLLLLAAMFILFARISGSSRTAGIGVAIYAANFNFLYWSAQYSYESLALPLFVFILMLLAERERSPRDRAREWAVPIVLGTSAIVVTHHLTSYALAVFLALLAATYLLTQRKWSWANPWPFAIFAAALAIAWLLLVANATIGYLSPVLGGAVSAVFNTASGEAPPRALFQGKGSHVPATPVIARAVALLAVGLLAAGLPFGLRQAWRRYRTQAFALIFMASSLGFFATLALRLAPAAWETGNRASEFFFIGLAFVLGCVGLERWQPPWRPWLSRAAVAAALGLLIVGGAIAGWPWNQQLAGPVRIRADGADISSPPLAFSEWVKDEIPEGRRFATSTSVARLVLDPGEHVALAGKAPDIQDMLAEAFFSHAHWELPLLRAHHIRYVAADNRIITSETVATSIYFSEKGEEAPVLPQESIAKFANLPHAARIFSNGRISVYDLKAGP
jgi:hypothetical protein